MERKCEQQAIECGGCPLEALFLGMGVHKIVLRPFGRCRWGHGRMFGTFWSFRGGGVQNPFHGAELAERVGATAWAAVGWWSGATPTGLADTHKPFLALYFPNAQVMASTLGAGLTGLAGAAHARGGYVVEDAKDPNAPQESRLGLGILPHHLIRGLALGEAVWAWVSAQLSTPEVGSCSSGVAEAGPTCRQHPLPPFQHHNQHPLILRGPSARPQLHHLKHTWTSFSTSTVNHWSPLQPKAAGRVCHPNIWIL